MKFVFFNSCDKKKSQTIKAKTQEELMTVAKIVKCELTKNNILRDIDFKGNRLMCKVDDKVLSMKELWNLLDKKLKITDAISKDKKKKDKDDTKKKKDKSASSISGKKKDKSKKKKKKDKKKSKKINYDSDKRINPVGITKDSDGLVRITRRH